MKRIITSLFLLTGLWATAQVKVGDNPTNVNASAAFEIESTAKGMLFPRMTMSQRNVISSPAKGLAIYNTTTESLDINIGTPASPTWSSTRAGNISMVSLVSATSPVGNSVGEMMYNTNSASGILVGPVYWDGAQWVSISSDSTTNINLTSATSPAGASVGQVAYNTGSIQPTGLIYWDGAQWKPVNNNNSVALSSATSPAGASIGQMIYNTNAASGLPVGPVYWDGTKWVSIAQSSGFQTWYLTSATTPPGTSPGQLIFNFNLGTGVVPIGPMYWNGSRWISMTGGSLEAVSLITPTTENDSYNMYPGKTIYNTNAASGVPVGPAYWDGAKWISSSPDATTNITLVSTTSPAGNSVGQMAYNTNASSGLPVGPVYWDGTQWVSISSDSTTNVSLTSATSPAGTALGQVAYNTNAAIQPAGLIYWDGAQWKPVSSNNEVALSSATSPAGASIGQMVYNTNASSGLAVGPVYWDGTKWISANGNNIYNADGTLTGNRTVTQGANSLIFTGTGNTILNSGVVGIGTATPNAEAALDVTSTSKGVLLPRVALTAANSASPLSAFVAGMTVYNTATAGTGANAVTPGLYYSDGAKWIPTAKDYVEDPTLGSIAVFPYNALPSSYLECDGAAVSRTTYAALFAKLGTTYGTGDGSTTFNLPDLRGEFIRGFDNGRGLDSSRVLGTTQSGSTKLPSTSFTGVTNTAGSHTHSINQLPVTYSNGGGIIYPTDGNSPAGSPVANSTAIQSAGSHSHTVTINGGGDAETRPRNVAMIYGIKAVESVLVPTATSSAVATAAAASAAATEPWYKVGTSTGATANTDNVYINGKVGIGTSNPYGNFNVDCGSSGGWVAFTNLYTNAGLLFNANANQSFIQFEGTPGPDTSLNLGARGSGLSDLNINGATGNVGIGTTTPAASAQLEVSSTSKGFLPPRMTQAQRTAISSPATGLVVYQTDGITGLWNYNGTQWTRLASQAQPSTSYFGYMNVGDIGINTTISSVGGFIVSATKASGTAYSYFTVTHNLGLTGNQDIHVSYKGLSGNPGVDNDFEPPLIYNVTANSFQIFVQELDTQAQNIALMIQLTNF